MNSSQARSEPTRPAPDFCAAEPAESSLRSVLRSLGFWFCLLLSVIAYALAMLSPRLVQNERLAARRHTAEWELQRLAEQVQRYERYSRQLVEPHSRGVLPTQAAREITLDPELQYQLDRHDAADPLPIPGRWLPSIVRCAASSATLRWTLLAGSAGLLLLSFCAFTEARPGGRSPSAHPGRLGPAKSPVAP